ncbi:MAG TPA: metallopeptidase TldD-related protein, partial [Candidatus Wallbacteria bacterium]|nr:metallopeptidase TldD-related protein [Candidatus Wallbacteria bacterium]
FLSKGSQMTVVLTPQVADSFIKKYLMSNLYGKLVVEKQSRFNIEDFKSGEKVTRDDISVLFTQSDEDLEINNIPLTFEGVPVAPAYFIKNGRLNSPMLDLKYAKKAEMQPNAYLTPEMFQSSNYSVKIETGEYEAARAVISDLSEGLIIFGVLGMHTQDHTSGDFSISSPYAVRVVDGKPEGLAKVSLAGNFFEQLNHHNTKFLNWYQEGDCFLMRCHCS